MRHCTTLDEVRAHLADEYTDGANAYIDFPGTGEAGEEATVRADIQFQVIQALPPTIKAETYNIEPIRTGLRAYVRAWPAT